MVLKSMEINMDNNKVSIIVPNYNTERYIEECLLSLINQTYKNCEIIIVDDCSTDKSIDICVSFEQRFSNVKLIKHKINKGIEQTRNDGINEASGEWIIFLDSDDTLELNAIELLLNINEFNNVDIIYFAFALVNNNEIFQEIHCKIESKKYNSFEFFNNLFSNIPISIISCIGNKLYRSSLIKKNNIAFDIKYKYNEDLVFAINMLQVANRIGYVDRALYKYLKRTDNSSSSYRPNMYQTMCISRLALKSFLVENNIYELKREYYQQYWLDLIYSSLVNEYQYNKKNFKNTYFTIIEDFHTKEMIDILIKVKMRLDYKLVLYCINKKLYKLLKFFLYLFSIYRNLKWGKIY